MKREIIPEKISKLSEYISETGKYLVKADANESPYLPSEKIMAEFHKALDETDFNRYPDPYARDLIEAFIAYYKVRSENVVAGNGSDELIGLICEAFLEEGGVVTTLFPDFSMYEFYSEFSGATVKRFYKDDSMNFDVEKLINEVSKNRSKILIFSNPCNPTGQIVSKEKITKIVQSLPETLIVVDEAYMEFSGKDESLIQEISGYENAVVLKTLSKAFGSAALRLGFCIGSTEIISALKKVKSPYNVNMISQIFGKIILNNPGEIAEKVSKIKENTRILFETINKSEKSFVERVYPTQTNFVYIKMKDSETAERIFSTLKSKGILVRLMGRFLRISSCATDENKTFFKQWELL